LHSCLSVVIIGEVVKIETFLKGDTMKINFQTAQLSRPQRESLLAVLDVLQSENENEIEVTPVEFPLKFRVKLDDDIEMVVGWNPESDSYSGITAKTEPEPDPIPESKKDTVDLPKQKPEEGELIAALDNAGNVVAGPELVMSEVGKRVQALAWELSKICQPLDDFRRGEVWIQFTKNFIKEFME